MSTGHGPSPFRHAWRCVQAIVLLAIVALPGAASAQNPPPADDRLRAYDDLIGAYRGGAFEQAPADLNRFLAERNGLNAATRWLSGARNDKRRADIEGALLLHSEAVILLRETNGVGPLRNVDAHTPHMKALLDALEDIDPASPFLKRWYVMWEAFAQAFVQTPLPRDLDFLSYALDAFRWDSQVLLAAGSRHQLEWWIAGDNSRRSLRSGPSGVRQRLVDARDWFRRSIAANSGEDEAVLRLAYVLIELGEPREAERELRAREWGKTETVFPYLAEMLLGQALERRGDLDAALRAYDRAITLTPEPQSARVARAHLAHRTGARADAAAAMFALAQPQQDRDPWWAFIRGQAWRAVPYREMARKLVRP